MSITFNPPPVRVPMLSKVNTSLQLNDVKSGLNCSFLTTPTTQHSSQNTLPFNGRSRMFERNSGKETRMGKLFVKQSSPGAGTTFRIRLG